MSLIPPARLMSSRIKPKLSTVPAATRGSDYVGYGPVSTCERHAASSKGSLKSEDDGNRVFHRLTRSVNTNPLSATVNLDPGGLSTAYATAPLAVIPSLSSYHIAPLRCSTLAEGIYHVPRAVLCVIFRSVSIFTSIRNW